MNTPRNLSIQMYKLARQPAASLAWPGIGRIAVLESLDRGIFWQSNSQ